MSRLYGSLRGQAKTEATRRASKTSGIQAHVPGWDSGIKVIGYVNDYNIDCFNVWITSGSNGKGSDEYCFTLCGNTVFARGSDKLQTIIER